MAREISMQRLQKDVQRVLNNPLRLEKIDRDSSQSRLHDDHDGTFMGFLQVMIGPNGDAWVNIVSEDGRSLRFRNGFGGGLSLRTHNALLILAEAMRLDNEKHPIKTPGGQLSPQGDILGDCAG